MNKAMINYLTLTNSKGRVIFSVTLNPKYGTFDTVFDGGQGSGYKQAKDFFPTAAACWLDNPSCKISGLFDEEFKAFVANHSFYSRMIKIK